MQLRNPFCLIFVSLRELGSASACSLTFCEERVKCKARMTDARVSVRVAPSQISGINNILPLRSFWNSESPCISWHDPGATIRDMFGC